MLCDLLAWHSICVASPPAQPPESAFPLEVCPDRPHHFSCAGGMAGSMAARAQELVSSVQHDTRAGQQQQRRSGSRPRNTYFPIADVTPLLPENAAEVKFFFRLLNTKDPSFIRGSRINYDSMALEWNRMMVELAAQQAGHGIRGKNGKELNRFHLWLQKEKTLQLSQVTPVTTWHPNSGEGRAAVPTQAAASSGQVPSSATPATTRVVPGSGASATAAAHPSQAAAHAAFRQLAGLDAGLVVPPVVPRQHPQQEQEREGSDTPNSPDNKKGNCTVLSMPEVRRFGVHMWVHAMHMVLVVSVSLNTP